MSVFFELRKYKVFPGKMNDWITLMEEIIIPFQVSKGMVIHGSFIERDMDEFKLIDGSRQLQRKENTNKYIWIRRFENEKHKEDLYKDVYESDIWINEIGPKVSKLIDRNSIIVHNLYSTNLSIMK